MSEENEEEVSMVGEEDWRREKGHSSLENEEEWLWLTQIPCN